MSSTVYDFVVIDDHNDTSGDGLLSVSINAEYFGRNNRNKEFDIEGDHGGQAYLQVNQNGQEFVQALQDEAELQSHEVGLSVAFYTNSKYLEVEVGGTDASRFEITRVYYVHNGNHDFADWSGQMEPTGDPGQSERYLVYVSVYTSQNLGKVDYQAYIQLTGYSGGSSYRGITEIIHHPPVE